MSSGAEPADAGIVEDPNPYPVAAEIAVREHEADAQSGGNGEVADDE